MRSLRGWILLFLMCWTARCEENGTRPKKDRDSSHRDSQLLSGIQQIHMHLSNLDMDVQRHGGRIDDLIRASARIEAQRQDMTSTLDRSESRILQSVDDVKSESRRFITLQDVMREDIEKLKQNQLLHKVWLEEQIQQIRSNLENWSKNSFSDARTEPTDLLSNLQVVQTTLSSLRRMVDNLQVDVNVLKRNVTYITNATKSMMAHEQQYGVTRSYLESALQMHLDQRSEVSAANCLNSNQTENLPQDCYEVQQRVQNKSGIYRIRLKYAIKPIFVYCEMQIEGGGWTVFQNRMDGSIDFLRSWQEYKQGFGNIGGEFWLGNENLHLLTHQNSYELRVYLNDFEDGQAYAKYHAFAVGSEREKYKLELLGPFTGGDAGDGLTYHAGMPFSTIDADNDPWTGGHCAKDHAGGWWYNQCDASNLNGKYLRGINPHEYQGVYWHEWQGPSYSLKATKMMLKPLAPPLPADTKQESMYKSYMDMVRGHRHRHGHGHVHTK